MAERWEVGPEKLDARSQPRGSNEDVTLPKNVDGREEFGLLPGLRGRALRVLQGRKTNDQTMALLRELVVAFQLLLDFY